MTMEKAAVGNKLDNLRVLDGVRAVEPGAFVSRGDQAPANAMAVERGLNVSDATALESAGWTFVKSSGSGDAAGHDVVVDPDGHLKILSHALNVKFDPSLDSATIDGILSSMGLTIRRKMGFAPNLFLVSARTDNPLSVVKSLNSIDQVLYAEPVLVEAIGGRR